MPLPSLPRPGRLLRWLVLVSATVSLSIGMQAVGAPSAPLFAGLVAGLVFALARSGGLDVPGPLNTAAFAVTGVVLGMLMGPEVVRSLGREWPAVGVSLLVTLLLTVVGGVLLARVRGLDRPTAVFGMIAGGASGVIAMSEDAGADARLVAVMQYLRVLLVLLLMPVVTSVVGGGSAAAPPGDAAPAGPGLAFLVLTCVAGVVLARLLRLTSAALLGPMLLVAGIALAAPDLVHPVPVLVQSVAFAVIGLRVGLRFDTAQLRLAARILPAALAMIVALVALCAALAVGLAACTRRGVLDWYLATTPGGLYAVLAAALQLDADAAFVTAVQVLRLFVMLLAAPLLAWLLRPGEPEPS